MCGVLSPFATGGGGGTTIGIVEDRITGGNATCPNTGGASWAVILQADDVTPFEIDIPAAIGDRVEIGISGMRTGEDRIDVAVVVGTTQVRYLATGNATPANDGDVSWYASGGGPFFLNNAPRGLIVEAGDLDGGVVRFCLVSNGDGTSVIEATENDTFYWRAMNYGGA